MNLTGSELNYRLDGRSGLTRRVTDPKIPSLSPPTMTDSRVGEETPLLSPAEDSIVVTSEEVATPLPRLQIGILFLVLLADAVSSRCIYPFINRVTHYSDCPVARLMKFQLISELGIPGGDEKKV